MEAIYHEVGRIVYDGDIPKNGGGPMTYQEYYLKDHLGNNRVRFIDKNGDGMIQIDTNTQENNELTASYHYYPFGMQWGNDFFDPQQIFNKYRYNGKEFIEDFDIGLYDYGARWYDPAVGRFMSVDPLADKYPGWNPYNYTLNNPVLIIDPNGQWPKLPKIIKSAVASTVAFVAGAANAVASNMTGGFPGTRGDPNDWGEHAQAASYGQTAGDAVSIVIGLYEMTVSAVGVTGEAIAAPETGGVTAAAIPATAALGAHGTVTAASGLKNLISDDKVVQANKNLEDLDNLPKKERMDKGGGKNRSRNNQVQNKQFETLTKDLSQKQKEQLHREIKELDLDYQGLKNYIKENYK